MRKLHCHALSLMGRAGPFVWQLQVGLRRCHVRCQNVNRNHQSKMWQEKNVTSTCLRLQQRRVQGLANMNKVIVIYIVIYSFWFFCIYLLFWNATGGLPETWFATASRQFHVVSHVFFTCLHSFLFSIGVNGMTLQCTAVHCSADPGDFWLYSLALGSP